MKNLIILLSIVISVNSYSQDSWVNIYQTSDLLIESFYKIHKSDNFNLIYIQNETEVYVPHTENGVVKKYSRNTNSWKDPANGFLNSKCGQCLDPPFMWYQCFPVPFFMISAQDTNFILNYQITSCASCPDASTYITYDKGLNQIPYYQTFGCGGSMYYPSGGDFDPGNDSVCYYGYPNLWNSSQPSVYKSTNRGQNWTENVSIPNLRNTGPSNYGDNLNGGFIKVNPFNTEFIFTAHRDYMMLSTNGGMDFNSINIPPLNELCFDYSNEIIYGITQNKIYTSVNNGLNWDSATVPFNLNTMEVSPDNNNIIYAGSPNGLFRTTDNGQNWNLYNNTFLGSKNVIGISKDPDSGDTIIVCTNDAVYKVFRGELTGAGDQNLSVPESFKLYQNYPNPFNPVTKINYELPQKLNGNSSFNVKLSVYNILGSQVAVLLNEKQNAGKYSVDFDGTNFTSGFYFYKLVVSSPNSIEADGLFEVKKMTLLK